MATKLATSLGALYAALEIPRVARWTVVALLLIHTGLLAYSAYVHSPTLNEPGHLVAGLSYWKFGRFDVYNVNPPLVRMVAALPVMAVGYKEDWSGFYTGPGARPEMAMGSDFVAANGELSFFLFMIARWACIPFSWLGAIVCYLWARDLYGRPSGVMAAAIWCFEPNILAHASLITSDAAGTTIGIAACYTFWRWLKKPTWSQAALTGVVLGLAELCKTTLILFYPLWPMMWLVYRWPDRRTLTGRDWLREAGMLSLRMVIGLYILNLGYGFEGSFTPLKEFHFVSDLFTGAERVTPHTGRPTPGTFSDSRFASSWLGNLPVPFPKDYLLGIDIQQRDFEHYGRPSYLHGVWQDHGWWYYYLYAAAIKVPLGLWALGVFTLFLSVREKLGEGEYTTLTLGLGRGEAADRPSKEWLSANRQHLGTSPRDEFILLFPAIVIFVVVSSKTGFSEHFRYVLPCFPFAFIWVSQFIGACLELTFARYSDPRFSSGGVHYTRVLHTQLWRWPIMVSPVLITWLAASSLWIYPHSLSYFNESIGGPLKGPKHLLGSGTDWGQDLLYVRAWVRGSARNDLDYQLAYYGYYAPRDVGFGNARPVTFVERGGMSEIRSKGFNIVSVNVVEGASAFAFNGISRTVDCPVGHSGLSSSQLPAARFGYSLNVYVVE